MAKSCSFLIGTTVIKNQVCFRDLRRIGHAHQYIIVEKDKGPYSIDEKRQFLRDLKSMGFPFKFSTNARNGNLYLQTNQMDKITKTLFGMCVRCLWEGFPPYQEQYCGEYDQFHLILPLFNQMKKHFPDESKWILFCIVVSIFTSSDRLFNGNHILVCDYGAVKPYSAIPVELLENKSSVNGTFFWTPTADAKFLAYCKEMWPRITVGRRTTFQFPDKILWSQGKVLLDFYKSKMTYV